MTTYSWNPLWGVPVTGCIFKGQALLGGKLYGVEPTFPSDGRIIRWSEIGAFRFLGQTAISLKNTSGYTYTTGSGDETVMKLMQLSNFIVAYSTMGIYFLRPYSQPAPTYGVDEYAPGIGILNPLAVGGDDRRQVFVDKDGTLRDLKIDQYGKTVMTDLGYGRFFKDMQEGFDMEKGIGVIVVVYNPNEDEYYISDGIRSFLLKETSLTEMSVAYTSYVNLKSMIVSKELFLHCFEHYLGGANSIYGKEGIYLETDIVDFKLSAIKTIKQVEVGGSFGTDGTAYVMVKWRNNKSEVFRDTVWKRCSPNGVCSPNVSGVEFKICVMVNTIEDTLLTDLTIEWQLSDKSSVRGNYASGASA